MTNNVRFRFSVGDTIRVVYNKYLARQVELVTLNTIFSVVITYKSNTQASFTLIKFLLLIIVKIHTQNTLFDSSTP